MDPPFQFRRRARNGKVARLPEATRERISVMIDDGAMYRDIIISLGPPGSPVLPYAISQMNISNWRKGGHQDWRRKQLQLELGWEFPPPPADPAAQLRMLLGWLSALTPTNAL